MKDKLPDKGWDLIRANIEGFRGEIHHLIQGQRIERLELMLFLTVDQHRGKNAAKNWQDPDRVPQIIKDAALAFWRKHLHEDDLAWFVDKGLDIY